MDNGDSGQPEMTLKKPKQTAMLAIEAFHCQSVSATTSIFAYTLTRPRWRENLQILATAALLTSSPEDLKPLNKLLF